MDFLSRVFHMTIGIIMKILLFTTAGNEAPEQKTKI